MIPNVVRGNGFRGALEYIFEEKPEDLDGPTKAPEIIDTNMGEETVRGLASEFGVVRQLNRRCKNPVWHVSLSFAIEDTPTEEQLDQIPALFIDKVGAQAGEGERGINSEDNQWVAVAHYNTDHLHIHLLLNRINYDGEVCYCKWDKNRSQAACREIERELGLVEVKGNSERLFLDGRLIARLEKEEQKTGVVDPRLERYRQEKQQSLEASHGRRRAKAAALRGEIGGLSERDDAGVAGTGIGSPDSDLEPAATLDPGLEQFEQSFERDLQAYLDHLLATPAGADRAAGEAESEADRYTDGGREDARSVLPITQGTGQQGGGGNVQTASSSTGAGEDGQQPARTVPEERVVPVKPPVRRPKGSSAYER